MDKLVILFSMFLCFCFSRPVLAGTGKILTWCSYYSPKNYAVVNRMRCTVTEGLSNYYCFRSAKMSNGTVMDLNNCEEWSGYVSDKDIESLRHHLGIQLKRTTTSHDFPVLIDTRNNARVQVLKNTRTKEIAIIHRNDYSYEKTKCESLGRVVAGEETEADHCWLNGVN